MRKPRPASLRRAHPPIRFAPNNPGRPFIQQSTWFLAGTRLAKAVRTNVRTHNLSAERAKSRGEVIEPAMEFLHGKQSFGNPALYGHNRAYKTRPRKPGNCLADAIDQGQIIQAVRLYGQYQRTVQVQKDRALLHLFWPSNSFSQLDSLLTLLLFYSPAVAALCVSVSAASS